MNEFHLVAQAKGGVGKSLIASLVGQYKIDHQKAPTICVDIDPLNNTFSQYKSLNVGFIDVTENGKEIVPNKFDAMINGCSNSSDDFVVDSGASVFISLMRYLSQDRILDALATDLGKTVFVHTIVVGGQAQQFTLDGLQHLLNEVPDLPNVKIVVWENEFFGPVSVEGHGIEKLKIVKEAKDRIAGFVTLNSSESSDAFNNEFKDYAASHLTMRDVAESEGLQFASKLRLNRFSKNIFEQLDAVIG